MTTTKEEEGHQKYKCPNCGHPYSSIKSANGKIWVECKKCKKKFYL